MDTEFSKHDILVEAHGLIFDLFVFGILITVFDFLRNRRESRSRYNEEIQDLLGWESDEAKVKILARLKRLYELRQRRFFLSKAYLKNADLSDYDLTDSILVFANIKSGSFIRSNLKNVKLTASNLQKVYFTSAILENTDLSHTNCKGAFFTDTDLINTNFEKADLRKASFQCCYYEHVNMKGALIEGACVDDLHWLDNLEKTGTKGIKELKQDYMINSNSLVDKDGVATYRIERIKPAHNNYSA
ncbi:pentapeptide repeat-containing protein [Pontibacter sp. CAU 1760]